MKAAIALIALLAVVCMAVGAHATEEYAARTNKSCEACHVDPAGGGTLTPEEGQAFGQQLPQKTAYRPLGPVLWFLRLIAGFIHIVFGFFWLGTILYVHLILKPAYAAGGLPKSELTLGWVSIIAMAATGTFLTLLRTPSWDALFATRFGLLLTVKIIVFLFMATTASIATFVIGPRLKRKGSAAGTCSNPSGGLSSFDGQEGRPAFIGYAGTMYDVSNSPLWKGGAHIVRHKAGQDLTEAMKQAPHGEEKVLAMPKAGTMGAADAQKRPPHVRAFYFFAYWSLVNVGVILAVLALWRWW